MYTKILIIFIVIAVSEEQCKHPIFCNQTILAAVANQRVFTDSKQFVDMVLKVPIQEALQTFEQKSVQQFVNTCFISADVILEPVDLPDWQSLPPKLTNIKDKKLKQFALDLNNRWKSLARKVNLNYVDSRTGTCTENCSSFLEVMNGKTIIIPGGRFREAYYWDTYWIIKGLLACNMLQTAEDLVKNFILIIETYGFIPNGFRQYYLDRSQPPFFGLMVKQVAEAYRLAGSRDKADALEQRAFLALVTQQQYFMSTHSKEYKLKSGRTINLNRYNADTVSPRPQSYYQDMNLVKDISDKNDQEQILKAISTMAESGLDFSSRWLRDPTDLKSSMILQMIPSDLNTLMGLLQSYLSALAGRYGRIDLLNKYQQVLKDRKDYFTEIFNGESYPDTYPADIDKSDRLYPSDYFPFFMSTQNSTLNAKYDSLVVPPSSLIHNGEQWDLPNVWAPSSWILHQTLQSKQAFTVAQQWVSTVYTSWKNEGNIYQKYRYDVLGKRGEGGQYQVQVGFGWTNGLCLYYLGLYPTELITPSVAQ